MLWSMCGLFTLLCGNPERVKESVTSHDAFKETMTHRRLVLFD